MLLTQFAWINLQIAQSRNKRDAYHAAYKASNYEKYYDEFKEAAAEHQRLYRSKLTELFNQKQTNNFKTIKSYWKFYSAVVQVKSDKTANSFPETIEVNGETLTNNVEISKAFNQFFTAIESK